MTKTYDELLPKVRDHLARQKSLKNYCAENNLNLSSVYKVYRGSREGRGEKLPGVMLKILEVMGFEGTYEKTYRFSVKKKKE